MTSVDPGEPSRLVRCGASQPGSACSSPCSATHALRTRRSLAIFFPRALWAAALFVGCGKADPDPATYPVTGTVVYKEQPVAGANVTFHASSTGTDAMAVTDERGAFDVSTYFDLGRREKRGMTVGEYRVTILKLDTGAIKTTLRPPQNLLPKKYEHATGSGLDARITSDGTNHFDFKLTD